MLRVPTIELVVRALLGVSREVLSVCVEVLQVRRKVITISDKLLAETTDVVTLPRETKQEESNKVFFVA